MTILIIVTLVLLVKSISMLLDIVTLSLKVGKCQELKQVLNPREKNYQFIKGLY